jgi:hypothetical protein
MQLRDAERTLDEDYYLSIDNHDKVPSDAV